MLQRSGASGGVKGSSNALWKLNVHGPSGAAASPSAPLDRASGPAESHCLIKSASSRVSAG